MLKCRKRSNCHDRRGFYNGAKPYRDYLIEALRHFGAGSFLDGDECWSLGGVEWCELAALRGAGIVFGEGSYHNVDCGKLAVCSDGAAVGHSFTEFMDIGGLWSRPRALCFDSTIGIVDSNFGEWVSLVGLGIEAASASDWVVLSWNFMTGYGRLLFDGVLDRYSNWLGALMSIASDWGVGVELFGEGVLAPKEGSVTPMISGHCKLSCR